MIVSALRVLEYVLPEISVQVVDMDGNDAFKADFQRIEQLANAGQICGKVRGSRLRYVELLVPLSEAIERERRHVESSASINARTNIGAYRQHLDGASVWALCLSRAFDGASA